MFIENLLTAFGYFSDPVTWGYIVLGSLIGLTMGALPGLGGNVAMALLIPFIWFMDPVQGIIFIMSSHASIAYGGSITAILFNTPGTGQNVATTFDGYPLTKMGRSAEALGASALACTGGSIVGALFLAVSVPVIRPVVMMFGPSEFFVLTLMGLACISAVSSGSTLKGLIAGFIGLSLSFVGTCPVSGASRFVFDSLYLWDGIGRIPVIIGFFAFGEMIRLLVKGGAIVADPEASKDKSTVFTGIVSAGREWKTIIQGSLIGTVVGIIPGVGGSVSNFIAYGAAASSKLREGEIPYGQGNIRGVIAPEASNDAKDGGALIPTLAFGIPGSSSMAILLMALLYLDVTPGPAILTEGSYYIYAMVFTIALATIVCCGVGIIVANHLSKLTFLPATYIAPFIFAIGSAGVYAVRTNINDLFLATLMGIVGYFMARFDYPKAPLLIGLILGGLVERYFHLASRLYGPAFIIQRPQSMILIAILFLIIWFGIRQQAQVAKMKKEVKS